MTTATSLETSPLLRARDGAAFALSAVLSPYLVIPGAPFGIVANQHVPHGQNARRTLWMWSALSVFFSTVIPALYVVAQVLRGKITDVHVMEREQREGPFLVAILSSAVGAWAVKQFGAPYPVWSLNMVLAQRLGRRLCPKCKKPYDAPKDVRQVMERYSLEVETFYRPVGCKKCRNTGFSGRIAMHELLVIDDGMREIIATNPTLGVLREAARQSGMITLRYDGLRKVKEGITPLGHEHLDT